MSIRVYDWAKTPTSERQAILKRSEAGVDEVLGAVKTIIDAVAAEGDMAVSRYTAQFDFPNCSPDHLLVQPEEFEAAEASLSGEVKSALEYAMTNVRTYHQGQKPTNETVQVRPGIQATERWSPIRSAGLYVPRGRGSFPSMLYMLAIPAQIAGVPEVVVCTPPNRDGTIDAACLYAARLCNVTRILRSGGAQAIAALAFGTASIPKVPKVIGPGSRYVAAAKRLLGDLIDTGLPAGPSESIVLADGQADPRLVAMDLLIEAEHGADSQALLITDSSTLLSAVEHELESRIAAIPRPRRDYVEAVFSGYGGLILVADLHEACDLVNEIAPEHLQIQAAKAHDLANRITQAGEILIGPWTPFSAANYATGPNAVLPSGGKARTYSGVGVRDFMRSTSVIECSEAGYQELKPHVLALADYEGFFTHAQALRDRP